MEDPDIRERLIAYVSAEPPRTLTADTILHAGRRARRRNQLLFASAAAGLVATAATVPAVLTHQGVGPDNPAAIALGLERVCAATTAPPRAMRDDDGFPPYLGTPTVSPEADALVDRRAAHLRCAVTELVTTRLPNFRYHQIGDADTPPAQTLAPLEFYASPNGLSFAATAVVVDDEGAAVIGFTIFDKSDIHRHPNVRDALAAACASGHCRTGRHGERIAYRAGDTMMYVFVDFGQTVVDAWMFADDLRHWHSQPIAPPRPELPLAADQLVAIATDPRLDVFAEP